MRKIIGLLLFAVVPSLMFSEVVFMPRIGFDIHKGIKSRMLDQKLVEWINKGLDSGKEDGELVTHITPETLPHSRPLITMITFGFDMQFISHGNGFTFFWNNEFGYAAGFKAYEKFSFIRKLNPGGQDIVDKDTGIFDEKQKIMMLSTEFLFGGTFRREDALNINFGLGLKASITPQTLSLIKGLIDNKFPEKETTVAVLPAIGGTFGITYYFNNVVGISASVSDFISFGTFISGKAKTEDGRIKTANAFASLGLANNFAMRLGLSLRVNGVKN